jgi:hypothetical protein
MVAALEPASPAEPTAAADKQHYDYDDQKSCGVHTVLLIAERTNECDPENQKGPSLVVPQNGLPSFYVAGGTPINDLVKQWKRHCWHYRLDLHRRVTAPADFRYIKVTRFLTLILERHCRLRAFSRLLFFYADLTAWCVR